MERPRLKRAAIICFILLIVVAAFLIRAYHPIDAKVRHILVQNMVPANGGSQWYTGMNKLWQLGPEVIPCLAAETRSHDTLLSRKYAALWTNSPIWLKTRLPVPVNHLRLRQSAMSAIAELGPLAARRAAPQVIAALKEKDFAFPNPAFSCLRWLVPDSKAATDTFKYGLSGSDTNWPRPVNFLAVGDHPVFGDDRVFWPSVSGVVPLLTNLLHDPGFGSLASIALGRIGSNAAPAIPALIDTSEFGAPGFTNAGAARTYIAEAFSTALGFHLTTNLANDEELNQDRAMAVLALGRIGVATPEVCAALARAWNSPDPWIRQNAALAVAILGPPMTNQLSALLSGLKDKDNSALDGKLQAIGKLGPGALDALPVLRDLTQTNFLASLVTNSKPWALGRPAHALSLSAKIAICQINPDEGRVYLPDIAGEIGRAYLPDLTTPIGSPSWDAEVFLTEPGPLSNDIVRVIEPLLDESNTLRQSLAAYVILSHDRRHPKALDVLHRVKARDDINDRLLAGRLLYLTVGDTNGLCAMISEVLQDPHSLSAGNACDLAAKMDTNALPALPAIEAALWHKDRFVRERAGVLVLKLAPQDLPINESK